MADYLEERRYNHLSALVRHPDLDDWCRRQGLADDYWTALDKYYSEHLPSQADDDWPVEADEAPPRLRSTLPPSTPYEPRLSRLLEPLTAAPRPAGEWESPILRLLVDVYGDRPLDREAPLDRSILAACEAVAECLAECRQVAAGPGERMTASQALRWVLGRIGTTRLAPPPRPRSHRACSAGSSRRWTTPRPWSSLG